MTFENNFRTTTEYSAILQHILTTTFLRYKLKATDVCVIATALGLLGTIPIRENTQLKETAEALILDGIERGKESFKRLAKDVAITAKGRRNKGKKPLFN